MKKRYSIPLFLLLAGGCLCFWKWDTWFKNTPEAPYSTPSFQDRITLTAGEDGETSRRISWRCDSTLSEAHLEYTDSITRDTTQIPAQGRIVQTRAGKSAFYQAELTGLVADRAYFYRVINDTVKSSWYSFSIPSGKDSLSFIYFGDIQDPASGKTAAIFKSLHRRYPHTAFWALAGDVIERPTDEYWNYWFSTMDSVSTSQLLLAATGNHEYLKGLPKVLDSRWTATFSYPHNGPKNFEGQSYVVHFKDLCFIVIDSDGIQGPVSLYRHYVWLKEILAQSDKKWKIVMMHHPAYSVRAHRNNFYVRYTFKPLYEKYGVDLVLQGHDHGYSRINTKNNGIPGSPVYIVSSCSPKHYNIGFNPIHDRLGSGLNLYQYITLRNDTLHYRSFTVEKNELYDELYLIRDGKDNRITDKGINLPEQVELPESYQNSKKINRERYNRQMEERREMLRQNKTTPTP
jgi:hypothetical protein